MASKTIKGLTVEIGGKTDKLSKALKDVEDKSRSLSKELGDINKLLKMDPGNADLLAQKQRVLSEAVENTSKKLETLREAERQVQEQFKRGEVSAEQVRALQREIVVTENKMRGYEKAARETAEAAERLGKSDVDDGLRETGDAAKTSAKQVGDFADATDEAEKSSGKLGETLGNVAKTGLAAAATAAAALVTGLVASAEATREYRTEMAKLDTAFTDQGFSSEAATGAYETLVGVLGETDQAVEAANHLAQLASNEEELATWTETCTGIYATFGASLPIEGLTEAANETAKTGQVTGSLADALNWASVDAQRWSGILEDNEKAQAAFNKATKEGATVEDAFNAALEACSTEAERGALIADALSGAYQEQAYIFQENNAAVIEANKANDAWMASLAGVGGAIEPIITDVKMMAAALLSDAVPGVQSLAEAFRGILNGEAGASSDFSAAVTDLVNGLISKITEALPKIAETGLAIVTALATSIWQQLPLLLAQGRDMLLNLSNGIRENLPSLVSQALDIITNFAQSIYNGAPKLIETGFEILSNLISGIMSSLPELIARVPEIISTFANTINHNFPTILAKGVQLVGQIIMGIIKAIPTLIANIPKIITAIVDVWEAFNWLNLGKKAITFLKDGVLKMVSAVKSAGKTILTSITDAIKNLPSNLLNLGKKAISDLGGSLRNGLGTVKNAATSIVNGVINTIKGLPSKMLSIGKDLVKGLWNGISDMTGWVIGKIQSFGDSVLGGIKSFFGIKSPSRVFRDEVGAMLAEGMAEGIEANAAAPLDAMAGLSDDLMGEANGLNGLTLGRKIQHTFEAPATAGASMLQKLDLILAAIERGQVITIDGKALVGSTADSYDNALGQRRVLAARGAR